MQCPYINHQPLEDGELSYHQASCESLPLVTGKPLDFQTHFAGCMEMYSDMETVANYLAAHEGWFCRCAEPMRTEPLSDNGYILVIGKYGAFGYEVEPKMGVILEPEKNGIYHMHSVAIPGEKYLGYEVDYQSSMQLKEITVNQANKVIAQVYEKQGIPELPAVITEVEWQLHLKVSVRFPQFIYKFPLSVIEKTGDRLLTEIVRQVSPRLTLKVQKDFHDRYQLPLPPKEGRQFYQLNFAEAQVA
jgi:hypothetical protein